MGATEIATFPLVAGANIGDPNSDAAPVVKDGVATISAQEGLHSLHFGTIVERPDQIQFVMNWESVEKHKEFMAKPEYGPFLKNLGAIFAGSGQIHHSHLEPYGNVAKVLAAPATEVATFYFEGEPPADYLDGFNKFREIIEKESDTGYIAAAAGPTVEELEYEGVKGKAITLLIGWQSVDAHMAYRQSQSFKDNIGLLRSTAKKIEMHHVVFLKPQ